MSRCNASEHSFQTRKESEYEKMEDTYVTDGPIGHQWL